MSGVNEKFEPNNKSIIQKIKVNTNITKNADHVVDGTLKTAKVLGHLNKVLLPVKAVVDTFRVGYNVHKDIDRDTTRNTGQTVASLVGGWGGGVGGAAMGAVIGSLIFPGVGTIAGGLIGGLSGGIGGSIGAEAAASKMGDQLGWDIENIRCKRCRKLYECKVYTDQSRELCPECIENEDEDKTTTEEMSLEKY